MRQSNQKHSNWQILLAKKRGLTRERERRREIEREGEREEERDWCEKQKHNSWKCSALTCIYYMTRPLTGLLVMDT